jgi:hypothetical protein
MNNTASPLRAGRFRWTAPLASLVWLAETPPPATRLFARRNRRLDYPSTKKRGRGNPTFSSSAKNGWFRNRFTDQPRFTQTGRHMRSTDLVWRRQYLSPTGDVVLLQSGVLPIAKFVDPKMGWSNVVKGQILRYRLPGWHAYVLQQRCGGRDCRTSPAPAQPSRRGDMHFRRPPRQTVCFVFPSCLDLCLDAFLLRLAGRLHCDCQDAD